VKIAFGIALPHVFSLRRALYHAAQSADHPCSGSKDLRQEKWGTQHLTPPLRKHRQLMPRNIPHQVGTAFAVIMSVIISPGSRPAFGHDRFHTRSGKLFDTAPPTFAEHSDKGSKT
jgi:hypothetical protein